jgi:hypothetical protein
MPSEELRAWITKQTDECIGGFRPCSDRGHVGNSHIICISREDVRIMITKAIKRAYWKGFLDAD